LAVTEPEVFVLADQTLNKVVAQIRREQWDMSLPADFARRDVGHIPTLREIVNYHAYDDAWVPDMLAGKTMEEVGKDAYKGDLLGDDEVGRFSAIVERACAAARAVTELDRTVHCSFGDFPTRGYFWQANMFRVAAGARHRAGDRRRPLAPAGAGAGDLGRDQPPCGRVAEDRGLSGGGAGVRHRPPAGSPAGPDRALARRLKGALARPGVA